MASQTPSVVTDEMRANLNKESRPRRIEVDKTQVRMFARSCQYNDPLFYDEDFAKSKGYRSIVAPPHYLGTPVFDPSQATASGPVRDDGVPYKRVLNGGTDIEYFDTIVAGDVLESTTATVGYEETAGRMGPMLITRTDTIYRRDGKVVAISHGTSIRY